MRIISKVHDYYDGVQALGQDRELVYIRNPVEDLKAPYPFPLMSYWDTIDMYSPLRLTNYIVGFCGRIYPALHLRCHSSHESFEQVCYSLAEVDAFVTSHFREKNVEDYHKKGKKFPHSHANWTHCLRREAFEEFFTKCEQKKDSYKKLFEKNNCPVFVAEKSGEYRNTSQKTTWNGLLKEVNFQRIKEPYTAFQEISMYLGNIAAPRKPIPKIDDETMAEAKGFDRKTSFRKESSKKKK